MKYGRANQHMLRVGCSFLRIAVAGAGYVVIANELFRRDQV